ncbi:MAG: hypothetical protein NT138_23085 [Planctomycetales bacterium]|nr:hypothetical protein [Planctomycetales bacterium]
MQLLVPESVRSSVTVAENITVSALNTTELAQGKTSWPALQGLASSSDHSNGIAFTGNEDAQAVSAMLEKLTDQINVAGDSAIIVSSEEPIPTSLLSQLPQSLHSLIRRPLHHDLFYLPTMSSELLASKNGLLDIVVQNSPLCMAIPKAPAMERFPLAGPGQTFIKHDSLMAAIDNAVQSQATDQRNKRCIESGLLLLWDFLDESHDISQTMEGKGSPRTADYWHGIMHRREPDAGNASYWFCRVGSHPALDHLGTQLIAWMSELKASPEMLQLAESRLLKSKSLDPFALIELSSAALRNPGSVSDQTLRMVQYLEMLNLLVWSCGSGG